MKGTVLGADQTTGSGHIRGEDGNRYAFAAADVHSARKCKGGETVDFEPTGNGAKDVYVTGGAGIPLDDLKGAASDAGKVIGELIANRPSGAEVATLIRNNSIGYFFLGRPAVFYSLLILVACFLPYTQTIEGMNAWTSTDYSVFGVYSLVGHLSEILRYAGLELKGFFMEHSTVQVQREFRGFGSLFYAAMYAQYLLYLIPLGAAYTIYREFKGGAGRGLRLLSSLLAAGLPTALILSSGYLLWITLPNLVENVIYFQGFDLKVPAYLGTITPTVGYIALIVTGILAMLAALGIIKAPLDYVRSPASTASTSSAP